MGQKVHPHGFRLGFNKTWRSRWYADKDYAKLLHEDLKLRDSLKERFAHAGVSKIEIERAANKLKIDIFTSRPGIIIGRKGTEVDKLKTEIQKRTNREVFINIQEIQKPELDARKRRLDAALTIGDLRAIAKRRTPAAAFDYTDGAAEGETVGTLAAPAEPAAVPHVQLGTRHADDPRGYVDPLTLLPPRLPGPSPAASPTPVMAATWMRATPAPCRRRSAS